MLPMRDNLPSTCPDYPEIVIYNFQEFRLMQNDFRWVDWADHLMDRAIDRCEWTGTTSSLMYRDWNSDLTEFWFTYNMYVYILIPKTVQHHYLVWDPAPRWNLRPYDRYLRNMTPSYRYHYIVNHWIDDP